VQAGDNLLERLRRGRGDAVRELMAMPRAEAQRLLLECLCTRESADSGLVQNTEGYVELVVALAPDLAPWFAWIEALPADLDEDALLYPFNLLGGLADRGKAEARAFLRRQAVRGVHWRVALGQALRNSFALDAGEWAAVVPRLDDRQLSLYVDDDAVWQEVAAGDQRVAARLAALRAERDPRTAAADYARAAHAQRRWRALMLLAASEPAAAAPLLVDGLWDASWIYREHCIARCDLDLPGARERVRQLAAGGHGRVADAARRRLAAAGDARP
jgi:hypothetical protein